MWAFMNQNSLLQTQSTHVLYVYISHYQMRIEIRQNDNTSFTQDWDYWALNYFNWQLLTDCMTGRLHCHKNAMSCFWDRDEILSTETFK